MSGRMCKRLEKAFKHNVLGSPKLLAFGVLATLTSQHILHYKIKNRNRNNKLLTINIYMSNI